MAILLFFIETKIGRTIAITAAIVAIIAGSWLTFKVHYYDQGWAAALHAVALQNEKAIKDGKDAYAETKACEASGGTWDITAGGIFDRGGMCVK